MIWITDHIDSRRINDSNQIEELENIQTFEQFGFEYSNNWSRSMFDHFFLKLNITWRAEKFCFFAFWLEFMEKFELFRSRSDPFTHYDYWTDRALKSTSSRTNSTSMLEQLKKFEHCSPSLISYRTFNPLIVGSV